jgi:hypothetical protein
MSKPFPQHVDQYVLFSFPLPVIEPTVIQNLHPCDRITTLLLEAVRFSVTALFLISHTWVRLQNRQAQILP